MDVPPAAPDVPAPIQRNHSSGPHAALSRSDVIATVLLLASLWLATRPYYGIIHDARLYTLLGLSHLYPGAYGSDLFLKYGSQDSFSFVGPLLGPALAHFSPAAVNLTLTILGEAVWLAAAIILVSVLCRAWPQRALALGTLIALPSDYAGAGIFRYGEPFFTPRPFAEAAILLAIAAFLRERRILSIMACIAALILHPVMAAPGIVLIFCLFAAQNRLLWLLPVIGTGMLLALAGAGIEPFARLGTTMSGTWLSVVMFLCSFAFIPEWPLWDFLRVGLQAAMLAVAIRTMTGLERRLLFAVVLTVAAGTLATLIGSDLLHNLLVINLQPVRAFWLFSVFVNLSAGAALYRLFEQQSIARWHFAVALAIFGLSDALFYLMGLALAPAIVSLALTWSEGHGYEYKDIYRRGAFALSAFCLGMALCLRVMATPMFTHLSESRLALPGLAAICIVLAAAILIHLRRSLAAAVFAVVAFALVVPTVDRRDAWERFIEGTGDLEQPARLIGDARNVYWEGGVELLWLRLRRPSYYSCLQASGVMFYPGTALEFKRRSEILSRLDTQDFVNRPDLLCPVKRDVKLAGPASVADIVSVCRNLPDLDMTVLLTKVDGLDPPSWKAPAIRVQQHFDGAVDRSDRYYFYDCRVLRPEKTNRH